MPLYPLPQIQEIYNFGRAFLQGRRQVFDFGEVKNLDIFRQKGSS